MRKYYSEVKKALKIKVTNKTDDKPAYLTHYLQSFGQGNSKYFESPAKEYLVELHQELGLLAEPEFQYYIPIKWDVPFPPPQKPKYSFIDLFAGIGGFRLGLQKHNCNCVFSSEINNSAKQTYEANFGEVPFGDIKAFTDPEISDEALAQLIPDHNILAGGFPCQPFSLAGVSARNFLGKAHGFLDTNQGNLFFDIARIVSVKKPDVVFLENVKTF
jgi:DNA (cytosine-5)-methyltransferase 1